jgi:hypothetical protein
MDIKKPIPFTFKKKEKNILDSVRVDEMIRYLQNEIEKMMHDIPPHSLGNFQNDYFNNYIQGYSPPSFTNDHVVSNPIDITTNIDADYMSINPNPNYVCFTDPIN